jgi:hypothetical protein
MRHRLDDIRSYRPADASCATHILEDIGWTMTKNSKLPLFGPLTSERPADQKKCVSQKSKRPAVPFFPLKIHGNERLDAVFAVCVPSLLINGDQRNNCAC